MTSSLAALLPTTTADDLRRLSDKILAVDHDVLSAESVVIGATVRYAPGAGCTATAFKYGEVLAVQPDGCLHPHVPAGPDLSDVDGHGFTPPGSDDDVLAEAHVYLAARRDVGRAAKVRDWLDERELEDCPVHVVMRPSVAIAVAEFLQLHGLNLAVAPTDSESMRVLLVVPSEALLLAALVDNGPPLRELERQMLGLLDDPGEASEARE